MGDQSDLFGSLPYQKNSLTSALAACDAQPYAKTARYRVWRFIVGHPGVMDEEIQLGLKMNPSTQRPRRVELMNAGLVYEAGRGKTSSGSEAVKWASTGSSYPERWPSVREPTKNSVAPSLEEFCEAVKQLRGIYEHLYATGQLQLFGSELEKVAKWMAKQDKP